MPGCKPGQLFIGRRCKKRADDLLKLDRHQLRLIAAIPTGHAPVKRSSADYWSACMTQIHPAYSVDCGDRNSAASCSLLRGFVSSAL